MAAGKEDTIKTKIAIDGEKEYKTACTGINTSLREIGSEMKLVSTQFAGNEKSVEGLTATQGILNKQLEDQKRKVAATEEALSKMREGGVDPTSNAYLRMQTNLNNATADMIKTEQEIDQTGKELEEAKNGATGFSEEIKKTGDETEEAGSKFSKVGDVLGTVGKAFGTALAALGTAALAAATGLAKLTLDAADFADDLMTQSTYTRQSTDDLQKYAYACRFIDTDMETLTKTMTKNIKSMDAARDGSAQFADAYRDLGVQVMNADGTLRDSNEVYWETVDALGRIENETERDAMAMQLFGKSAQELNSVIEAGSEAFKALGDEAEAMGVVMSEEALASLGEFKDKIDMLEAGFDGLKKSASLIALPFMDMLAGDGIEVLKDFSKGIQDANGDLSKMGDVIGNALGDILNLMLKHLPAFVDMGVKAVQSLVGGVANNAPMLASAAVQIVGTLVNGIAELLPVIINGAVQIVVGLAQGLGESLPQLIPQVVQMVMTIIQTLVDNIPLLVDAALQLVIGLAQGLLDAIPVLVAAIPEIIDSIITAVLESIPLIIQAGIDLLTALVEALPIIITAIVEAIPQIIDGIITAVVESIPLIIQAGIDLLVALIQALPTIITTIVSALPQIITAIVGALIGNIDQIIVAGVQLFVALIENLPRIIFEIGKAIPQIIAGIVAAFMGYLETMAQLGLNLIEGVWEGIKNAAGWLKEKVTGFFSGIIDGVKGFLGIHSPSTVFAGIGGNMAAGVGEGFGGEMDGVSADMRGAMGGAGKITAEEAIRAVSNGIIANISALDSAVTAVVERITTGLAARAQNFDQIGRDIAKNIASGMVTGVSQITAKVPQITQSIITAFIAQHQKFTTEGIDADKSIASGMVSGVSQITSKVPQIVQPIITALRGFASEFTTAGEDMVRGIWQGFQNMQGWLESNVRSLMRSIVAAVQAEMQINSPSKVFAGIGEYMAEGLGVGFAREVKNAEKSIRRATASTVPNREPLSGRVKRNEGGALQVIQHIYANETSYAAQQREAAKNFQMAAREVMA